MKQLKEVEENVRVQTCTCTYNKEKEEKQEEGEERRGERGERGGREGGGRGEGGGREGGGREVPFQSHPSVACSPTPAVPHAPASPV